MHRHSHRRAIVAGLAALCAAAASPFVLAQTTTPALSANTIVIPGTLEASMGYPQVHVRLKQGDKTLTGQPSGLGGIKSLDDLNAMLEGKPPAAGEPDTSFKAFFDTGASAYVLSKATAERFGVKPVEGAVYHEAGLHGETGMGVSEPYSLELGSTKGTLGDEPGAFVAVQTGARFQLNQEAAGNALVEMTMGEINVIGMPAIKRYVAEVDPAPMEALGGLLDSKFLNNLNLDDLAKPETLQKLGDVGDGPAVTLHPAGFEPERVDIVIPLEYVSYSRLKNPKDKGPLPELAENPTLANIKAEANGKSATGRWLLDTGAPASIISTATAKALGLYNDKGEPARDPDFELPLGGIGGQVKPVPGYKIDRLTVPAADGKTLVYEGAFVLVNDVSTQRDDGSTVTLDGIFGTNLLFPTVEGIGSGFPTGAADGPFKKVWIDGPGKRLLLERADAKAEASTAPATQR